MGLLAAGVGGVIYGMAGGRGASAAPSTEATIGSVEARHLKINRQSPPADRWVSDQRIGEVIDKGAAWLLTQFKNNVIDESGVQIAANDDRTIDARRTGADALCVYALIQAGLASDDAQLAKKLARDGPLMKGLLDALKKLPVDEACGTYARGIRSTALALAGRKEDRAAISSDVQGLLDSCGGGGYAYGLEAKQAGSARNRGYAGAPIRFDNSNSQYGLLGVWSAAEMGAEIPQDYWQAVERHWTTNQLENGQWGYKGPNTQGLITMTCAGIASMFVCHDYLDDAKFGGEVGREPFSPPLAKALEWMESGENAMSPTNPYGEYGIERVGLASGFKYFGMNDWYRRAATKICHQKADGPIWPGTHGDAVDTAYCLLFLSRGRHPILMNKLRFEHFWSNRPRDVARLADYAGHELETVFNWQVVNLQHEWSDWTDAPILMIASHEAAKLGDADYAKIRAYVNSGGMLFTQADGSSAAYTEYVQKTLVPKVFPEYGEMTRIPASDPIYSAFVKMSNPSPLSGVSNGARWLMVHSPKDISQFWQQRASKSHKDAFDLGLNIFVYSAGKQDFRNRIASAVIPEYSSGGDANSIEVARVKYALPTWDPEPYAWVRFSNWMGWETSVKTRTRVVEMEKLGELSPSEVPLACMTGTVGFSPNDAQVAGIKKYVENGGVLFVDACGGGGFNEDIKKLLAKAFAGAKLARLGAQHPLLSASGEGMSDLSRPELRSFAKVTAKRADGFESLSFGKGQVIYSSQDITNGLLGAQTYGVNGYQSPYCLEFVKNLLLWSARGAGDGGGKGAGTAKQ